MSACFISFYFWYIFHVLIGFFIFNVWLYFDERRVFTGFVFCFKCFLCMDWNRLFLILGNLCFHSFENYSYAAKSGSEHPVSREITEGRMIVFRIH